MCLDLAILWPGLPTDCPRPSPLNLTVPAPVTLQEGLPMSPAKSRCHHHGLVRGPGHSLQAAQLPAAAVRWALGRKMPGRHYCGLLCRVCVSYLMCVTTRPNFCESAQELFMASDILTNIILCVLLYVHVYKIHNIFRHFVVVIISFTN